MFKRVMIVALFLFAPCLASATEQDVFARFGLQSLTPPKQAAALDTEPVNAGVHTLSQHRGEWILLTFFATWCGPCMTEMPALQSLHESLEGEAFLVLGVSIDDTRPPLDRWLKKDVVRFPIVHDANKSAERMYGATSIPLSYVINPAGEVVAVAKGARDWSRTLPLFQTLLGIEVTELPDINAPLPVLAPPTGEVVVPTEVVVGETFEVVVKVLWTGQVDDYFLLPPKIDVPKGVSRAGSSVMTTNEGEKSTLSYRYAFLVQEEGVLTLPNVMVRYQPIAGGPEGGVELAVAPMNAVSRPVQNTRFIYALVMLVAVLILLGTIARKRSNQEEL